MNLHRRDLLAAAGAAGLASLLPGLAPSAPAGERKRSLRLAHLTDVHVEPERSAPEGMAACLHHVQEQSDRPELILFGGDCVMDAFAEDRARTRLQWDLWHKVCQDECSLDQRGCIGNHDIWGWDKSASGATGNEPDYGKKWAVEALRLPERYYSFDRGGWHFVALDGVQPNPAGGYLAYLDDAEFDWLRSDLEATPAGRPVIVWSHIPILSAAIFQFDDRSVAQRAYNLGGSLMHTDAMKIAELFLKHPNVKLCLSGHLHLVDRVDYNGVAYLCDGAVSGAWWKGRHFQCGEGYALVDLYDDGTFDRQYVEYGWKAAPR